MVSPGYLKENEIPLPESAGSDSAETMVYVLVNDRLSGYISLSDSIRPESADAIRALHENRIKSVLLTGDNRQVAESVSKKSALKHNKLNSKSRKFGKEYHNPIGIDGCIGFENKIQQENI